MHGIRQLIHQHSLTTFFALSVGLGWLFTWAMMAFPSNPVILPLLALPISYAPAGVAWLLVRWVDNPAQQWAFRQRLWQWRVGWRWFWVAVLALPLIHLAGVGLAAIGGGQFPFHPQMLVLLLLFLPANLGEEIGWRGYALPRLQERFSPLIAGLIIGVFWGAFHLVALLANHEQPWRYVAASCALMLAMSVLMTWLFNQTKGSVPLMALTHAMYDTVSMAVVPLSETGAPLLALALSAGVAWVIVFVVVGLDHWHTIFFRRRTSHATVLSFGDARCRLGGQLDRSDIDSTARFDRAGVDRLPAGADDCGHPGGAGCRLGRHISSA